MSAFITAAWWNRVLFQRIICFCLLKINKVTENIDSSWNLPFTVELIPHFNWILSSKIQITLIYTSQFISTENCFFRKSSEIECYFIRRRKSFWMECPDEWMRVERRCMKNQRKCCAHFLKNVLLWKRPSNNNNQNDVKDTNDNTNI